MPKSNDNKPDQERKETKTAKFEEFYGKNTLTGRYKHSSPSKYTKSTKNAEKWAKKILN